ncbi:hypothetical protein B484DRAFT_424073 [Ochromonadaceae sp. CCMP2298]|nr:hypothetical protein B484DRAFT_424073 [Ochromonadaceae sp. CCMP2298]
MNIAKILLDREVLPYSLRTALDNSLEDSFISGNARSFDTPLPASVSSTIAIAISCDGRTFATTHGDHTVKVFTFLTGQEIRVFRGHPRTPWTIKYHPLKPNLVASGCLGFQVRDLEVGAEGDVGGGRDWGGGYVYGQQGAGA